MNSRSKEVFSGLVPTLPSDVTMVLVLDGSAEHVAHIFRFAEGIWLHRKSRQIRFFFRKKT